MPQNRPLIAGSTSLLAAALMLTGCGSSTPAEAEQESTDLYTVQRVVDGDTIEVEGQGEELTVRLLNIDTPETKDPNEIVECLGPEATELTESLLEEGDQVRLEYDVEREDSYGRTLAGVYEGDTLINAEIARAGLGVPMAMDPNYRFYDEVKAAFDEASDAGVGFFDPSIGCTIPAQDETAQSPEDAQDVLDDLAEAADAHAWVGVLRVHPGISPHISSLQTLSSAPSESDDSTAESSEPSSDAESTQDSSSDGDAQTSEPAPPAVADSSDESDLGEYIPDEVSDVEQYIPEDIPDAVDDYVDLPEVSAPEPAAPAPAPAPRPAPAPKPAPVPAPKPAPAPKQDDSSSSGGGGAYPGYTGPRCYAPGGKTWTPC